MLTFCLSFLITLILTPPLIWLGPKIGMADVPGGRRLHQGVISRLGGVAIFGGFLGAAWVAFSSQGLNLRFSEVERATFGDSFLLTGVLTGAIFVFLFGLVDDYFDLPAWPQCLVQFGASLIAIYFTIFIEVVTFPFFGETNFPLYLTYPLTVFWMIGMINTVNFLDGLNGLAAGVACIAAILFAWHAHRLGQQVVYLFPLALAGACLGFLLFNFSPAKIFMGSTGSYTLGWALASLSILAPAKVATALLVLGIPIMDVAWLLLTRWRETGQPFRGGRDHLHFRLQDRGYDQRLIVLGYYLFCATFGILALLISSRIYKLVALMILGLSMLVVLWQLAKPKA